MISLVGEVCCDSLDFLALTMYCLFYEVEYLGGNLGVTDMYIIDLNDADGDTQDDEEGEGVLIEDENGNQINPGMWVFNFYIDDNRLQAGVEKRLKELQSKSVVISFLVEPAIPDEIAALN